MSTPKYDWIVGETPPPLDEHSAAKHEMLRQYVATYVDVLMSNPRREVLKITLVDGFSGGGEYKRNGLIVPGSPLIVLNEIAAAQARIDAQRTKPAKIDADFVFVEKDRSNYAFLQDALKRSPHGPLLADRIHLRQSSFEEALPGIITHISSRGRADRAIFFLDQFGYNSVSLQCIRSILAGLANPEIIVTFNVDWLIDYLSTDETFLKAVKPVELTLADVQQLLNQKDQRDARWLIQNMLYTHFVEKTGAPYYTPFFIKSNESHRSYWLIHISKHPTARDEMAALHWRLQNHFVHHGRAGLRMLGFDPGKTSDQKPFDFIFDDDARARSTRALMNELPEQVFGAYKNGTAPPTLLQLFDRVCNQTPATKRLLADAIITLREEKEFEILTSDGRSRPRTSTIDDDDRIVPARQRDMFSPLRF